MPRRNISIDVNVVCKGSPSRMRRVRRISLGMTILPRSSTRRTIPVAVPGIFVGDSAPSSSADRCHSLSSLLPPPAALASLPSCFHISSLLVNSRITMLLFVKSGGLYCSNNRTLFSNLFQSFPSISLVIIAEFCYILE